MIYKAKKFQAQKRLYAPPWTRDDPRPSLSNLCKSAHDFRKLTIPWSPTALDQQNPEISGLKPQARASTRRQSIQRCCLQFHTLTRADKNSQALTHATHATRAAYAPRALSAVTSWMTSSSADPFVQIRPEPT